MAEKELKQAKIDRRTEKSAFTSVAKTLVHVTESKRPPDEVRVLLEKLQTMWKKSNTVSLYKKKEKEKEGRNNNLY